MFINENFNIEPDKDNLILITDKEGIPYEWGKNVVHCYCPEYYDEESPLLIVKYNDNTWSLCHALKGPMEGATQVSEIETGKCPIKFSADYVGDFEYTVDNHTYDCYERQGGCLKKTVAGLLALGVLLMGAEGVFRLYSLADKEDKSVEKQEQKDNKKQHIENKEKYIDCSQDTCTIIQSATKAVIQEAISGFRTRG